MYDLSVVEYLCMKIGIMYLGMIVEIVLCDELFINLLYFYMKVLLLVVLILDLIVKWEWIILEGDILSLVNLFLGCCFYICCLFVMDVCKKIVLEFCNVGVEYFVVCYYV